MRRTARGESRQPVWRLDSEGVLDAAKQLPSPNFDERPPGSSMDLLVIHNISLPPGEFAGDGVCRFFTNCLDPTEHPYYGEIFALRVSSHFFIRRDGALLQFVPCVKRAWHAGQSEWRGRSRCNDFSIGVELEGSDDVPFTAGQYAVLARLAEVLKRAYPIQEVVGHCDIATPPGRKTDPGPYFDWTRFRKSIQV